MEETLCTIRESNRSVLNINRRRLKDEETDLHRSLATLCITSEIVIDIVNKLKTKSMVTVTELRNLKNALIDDEKNMEIVLNTHGALRGLVRELSGHNERKQCEAASCCCNLALGGSQAGAVVAKAAGPYLISALSNLNIQFAVTCTWSLGNLAGSGLKACELLTAQGAFGKLTDQLIIPNQDLSDAAFEALTQFTYQSNDELSTVHFLGLLTKLQELPVTKASLRLLFVLSCHNDFSMYDLKPVYTEKILEYFYTALRISDDGNIEDLIYSIRILANFNNVDLYGKILSNFVCDDRIARIKDLLDNSKVYEDVLWLLGNMYNLYSNHEFFHRLIQIN